VFEDPSGTKTLLPGGYPDVLLALKSLGAYAPPWCGHGDRDLYQDNFTASIA